MIPVFDGHNDFLQRMVEAGSARNDLWQKGDGTGHLDLPRIRKAGFAGGFFAIWIPSPWNEADRAHLMAQETPPYDTPLPREIEFEDAIPHGFRLAGHLLAMERMGDLSVVRSAAEIRTAMAAGRIAAIMHMEGAEAIEDLDGLYLWHRMGLRSLGPVWSRPTRYGHGVPFRFPSTGDTGPGLTDAGKQLIRDCNALRIMVDLAHLNEAGFNDVAAISDAPLVSSHSGAYALSNSSRNLTDRQLAMIAETRGLVGLNFAAGFMREDGRRLAFEGYDPFLRQLDYLLEKLGEKGVAFGSDFDGALMPANMPDVTGLPGLIEAMRAHGYDQALLERIAWRNWVDMLERIWGD